VDCYVSRVVDAMTVGLWIIIAVGLWIVMAVGLWIVSRVVV
jgi:hypothetical protein